MIKTYEGIAESYFETGMEGVRWVVETTVKDKELLHGCVYFIKEGDHALITSKDGSILFDDVIVLDTLSCRHSYPHGGGSQQVAGGMYTHWIQHGFSGDEWNKLFHDTNITITSGNDNSSRIEEIKNTIPTHLSKQNKFKSLFDRNSKQIPNEQPKIINSFAEYNNDLDEKEELCYNKDKFDLSIYQSLLVNMKVLYSAIENQKEIIIYSSSPINENEIVKSFEINEVISDEVFDQLLNDNGLKPFSRMMFKDDDYKISYKNYCDTIISHYESKKDSWKSFKFYNDSKPYFGAIIKLDY